MIFNRPEEECGIFGIFNHPEAANLTYLGLYALQHRGQESCGIVSSDGKSLHAHKSMGLVADVFGNQEIFKKLPGKAAIGHVRYSTAGSSVVKNVQPIMVDYSRGSIAVAHNGNIVNAQLIKDGTGGLRLHLPDHHGYRDHRPPAGDSPRPIRWWNGSPTPEPDRRGLLPPLPDRDRMIAVTGSQRLPPLVPGQTGERLRGRLGELRPGPDRGRVHPGD